MGGKKIVVIGAGSAMFTQGLVADLITSNEPWALGLVDTDPVALEVAQKLAERMTVTADAPIDIEASTNRCDLLPGADVAVTTVAVGGRRAWEADVLIPRKYGIYQPVGDTAMPGGISRAMRMVPAMVDIANDVLRLCPNARFFNYANPMAVNCWAVREATGADMVGLCIGVFHVQQQLARYIGVDPEQVTSLVAGLNHFTWIYDLRWNGRDAWPLVRARLEAEKRGAKDLDRSPGDGAPGGDSTLQKNQHAPRRHDNPFSWSLFEEYGAYPAVNDRHVVEFFPDRFREGQYYGKTLGVDSFSFEGVIAYGDEIYERMRSQALGEMPLDDSIFERAPGEHAQLAEILVALDKDQRKWFSANVPNRGAVPNLPDEAVLELTCAATARGMRPLQVSDLPDRLAAPLRSVIGAQALTVEAALSGDRKLFVEALLADGAVPDRSAAEKLGAELLQAHRQYLPQFY